MGCVDTSYTGNVHLLNSLFLFLGRGAGHVHGVLWIDWDNFFERNMNSAIKYLFEGEDIVLNEEIMKKAFKNLKNYNILKSNEIRQIVAFSDQFNTCSLDETKVRERIHRPLDKESGGLDSEMNDNYKDYISRRVIEIAQTVNKHHHTKACRKHKTKCRFYYPKFPSTKTLFSIPVSKLDEYVDADDELDEINKKSAAGDEDDEESNDSKNEEFFDPYFKKLKSDLKDLNAEERKKKIAEYRKILVDVKAVLEDEETVAELEKIDDLKKCVETLCDIVGVSLEDYENALKISFGGGHSIVLQRHVRERFINNYNPEWLYCWNGNMDLQVCLDYHSVITYITNYYSKSDSVTMDYLKEAARQFGKETIREKMSKIMNVYLTHRQMGHPEATYRMLQALHLKESNLASKFVPTGFPSNRSKYLQAVNEEFFSMGRELITIEGKEGEFVEKPSLMSKYERRPRFKPKDVENLTQNDLDNLALKYLTYAQFAKEYDPIKTIPSKKKKKSKKSKNDETETSDDDSDSNEDDKSDTDSEDESDIEETDSHELHCEIVLTESDIEDEEDEQDINSSSEETTNNSDDHENDDLITNTKSSKSKISFFCDIDSCEESFTTEWALENHKKVEHYYCDICDEMFDDHHFHCDICGKILDFITDLDSAKSEFYKHKKTHKVVLPKRNFAPGTCLTLPKYFQLEPNYPGEPKYMKLRTHPASMRLHKIKQQNHEYFYSEIQLYSPFYKEDSETDGLKKYLDDEIECRNFYVKKSTENGKSDIQITKNKVMPHLESVTEGRLRAEESKEMYESIGAQLDPEKE